MGSISRYIFRTTLGAFLVVLVSLTAVIWVTQALRDIDIMTSQGQTILVFVGITGLIIPLLILVIAPIALLIAVAHVLNKLSSDSEIIVMNAAGMSPWVLFRAFLAAAVVVSLLVGAISAYFAPKGLRMLRDKLTEVRANVVSTIVQPGRFSAIENGVTIHIRERRPNGQLAGIFLDGKPVCAGGCGQQWWHVPRAPERDRPATRGWPTRSRNGGLRSIRLRPFAIRGRCTVREIF